MSKDSPARYYQKNKEKIKKKSCERYQNKKKKKKKKKRQRKKKKKRIECSHEQYNILSESEKQKLVEYKKSYYEMQKRKNLL